MYDRGDSLADTTGPLLQDRSGEEEPFDEEGDPMTGARSRFGLERQGMRHLGTQHWNQSIPVLYEHAIRRGEGELARGGSMKLR